jgi:hypothetical protein
MGRMPPSAHGHSPKILNPLKSNQDFSSHNLHRSDMLSMDLFQSLLAVNIDVGVLWFR